MKKTITSIPVAIFIMTGTVFTGTGLAEQN